MRDASSGETPFGTNGEPALLCLLCREPGEDASQIVEAPISLAMRAPNAESGFAAAMAGFGQILWGGIYFGDEPRMQAIALAEADRGNDPFGSRHEATKQMRMAANIAALEQNSG